MYVSGGAPMRKSFKDSLKVLEADIQHANTLASDFSREYDGACLQMRMSYSPAAHFFLFLVQWTDCHLAGALGLLRILIYKVYVDGTTTMSTHERKASIREFYEVSQIQKKKQKAVCMERYRRKDEEEHRRCSELDIEREEECGICMEMNSKIVLPNCNHAMCLKCYREWIRLNTIILVMRSVVCGSIATGPSPLGEQLSLSSGFSFLLHLLIMFLNSYLVSFEAFKITICPFCRDSLKRTNSGDLWVFLDSRDVVDMTSITRENLKRLFMYIDKLPLIVPDTLFDAYDTHVR
ncbi:UNVERIFIED_CONTAM: E3 ubiquitin-protein ligase AIRP2 [Sesamum calycinum]|uniref:E3 ubiquitin-protein ligase AIRP2 n=1 Tax=Sesamum calycinum TaxID=2727403 RepID=A0AAW2Q6A2_9LAMI